MSKEYEGYDKEFLIEVLKDQDIETFDLVAKVVELINVIGWDDDDCYTFSDGDKWYRFEPMEYTDADN